MDFFPVKCHVLIAEKQRFNRETTGRMVEIDTISTDNCYNLSYHVILTLAGNAGAHSGEHV